MSALLELTDLHTRIRRRNDAVHAVDGVSLKVDRGEVLGLVGESGCGKTMTALSVMQLLPPGGEITSGRVVFDGEDLTGRSQREMAAIRAARIAMVFQDPLAALNPTMTVGAQIIEAVLLHQNVARSVARKRAEDVFDLVRIPSAARRLGDYPHQFSGGMRQRAMIAMALACEPDLLIADEPTTALDVTTQQQLLTLFDELRTTLQMAMILVTHDLGVIAGRADRVNVMYAGKIVETADASDLFADPRHRYTEALFRAVPDGVRRSERELTSIPGLPPDLAHPPAGCRFAPRCAHRTDDCVSSEPALLSVVDGADTDALGPEHEFACIHPPTPTPRTAHVEDVAPAAGEEAAGPVDVVLSCRHVVRDYRSGGQLFGTRGGSTISAVADVSLDVLRGETLGLVGESGCGKSTLSRLLVALERPTSGSVLLGDTDLAKCGNRALRARRHELQLVFQDASAALDPRMRVGSILAEPLRVQRSGTRAHQRQVVDELLAEVGLPAGAIERYPHEFSGGQRQRIALARALALRPKVVVADEPVSALDVSVQAQILNLMASLQREHDLTYVFISHDLSVVRYLADRIGVMYLGKLVELGPRDGVYHAPLHPYTRGLIDAAPVPDPDVERAKKGVAVGGELPSAADPPSGCRFRTRCPQAQEICAQVEPPMQPAADPRHAVACHFPLGEMEKSPAA
jgi:peptide/nickel transport system ATP-binding protein